MGIWIFIACFFLIMLVCDFQIRFMYYSDPKNFIRNFNRVQNEAIKQLLNVAKIYVGFKVVLDSDLKKNLPNRFLIISNHQSLVDIAVLTYAFPEHNVRFVAKKELKYGIPLISFALRKGKHALITRKGDFRSTRKELINLARLSKRGICPVIFPEGTRSRNGIVGRFHSAAVRIILENSRLPVVSVAVGGGSKISKLMDLFRNLKNCIYRVKFISLYPPTRERGKIMSILKKSQNAISLQVESWKTEMK